MQPPRRLKDMQRLAGCMASLGHFISKFGERALPFFKIMKRSGPFKWTPEAAKAFEDLKKYLASPPIMVAPTPSRASEAVSCSHSSDGERGLGGRGGRANPRQEKHPLTKPRTPRQGSRLVKPRASSRAHANGAGPPRGPASRGPRQGLQRASRGTQRCYVIDHARRASRVPIYQNLHFSL